MQPFQPGVTSQYHHPQQPMNTVASRSSAPIQRSVSASAVPSSSASTHREAESLTERHHVPLPAPPLDDMAPQNVSFIESHNERENAQQERGQEHVRGREHKQGREHEQEERDRKEREREQKLQSLQISSGSKTYRLRWSSWK